jgi:hypothetical protein
MARETTYFVQAFNTGKGGNLKADALSPANRRMARFERRSTGAEQTWRRCLFIHRRSRDG